MSAADPIAAMPAEVVSRLGVSPAAVGRFGSSRVLLGNGLVLKAGPEDRTAREAFVLGGFRGLPVRVPRLLDAGEGWLLLEAVEVADRDGTAWRDAALADLACLHESFAEKLVLDDPRLRSVIAAELTRLTARGVALAGELELPAPLRVLVADLEPLLAEVRGARTLVHGDAWPGNVLPTSMAVSAGSTGKRPAPVIRHSTWRRGFTAHRGYHPPTTRSGTSRSTSPRGRTA